MFHHDARSVRPLARAGGYSLRGYLEHAGAGEAGDNGREPRPSAMAGMIILSSVSAGHGEPMQNQERLELQANMIPGDRNAEDGDGHQIVPDTVLFEGGNDSTGRQSLCQSHCHRPVAKQANDREDIINWCGYEA